MGTVPFTAIYPDGAATAAAGGAEVAIGAGGNPLYPGMPEGATPIHRDKVVTTATTTVIWAPSSGRKFTVASCLISTDTAMRVALVDDSDIEGSRVVDLQAAANSGGARNLVPVPYPSKNAGNALKLVTGGAGNTRVVVEGWEQDG